MGIIDWQKIKQFSQTTKLAPESGVKVVAKSKIDNSSTLKQLAYALLNQYLWDLDNNSNITHITIFLDGQANKPLLEFKRPDLKRPILHSPDLTNFKKYPPVRRDLIVEIVVTSIQYMFSMKDKYESGK